MTQESTRESREVRLSELHEVCASGDIDVLEEMMKTGRYEHVNYKDPDWDERTPLHWCSMKGKGDMVRSLVDKGAHPGLRSSCGWTAAHYAAEAGRTNVLRTLHLLNSPMDRRDLYGDTPRRIAEIYGHKEAVEFLKLAETEYRDRRTNAELIGEVEPYDDEDMEWCIRNNFVPDSFLSADDLSTDLTGTFSLKSYSESIASSKRSSRRSRHYGKTSTKSSERKSSTKSTRQKSAESSKQSEHTDKKGRKKSLTKNVHKKSLGRISETKSPPTKQN